MSVSGMSGPRSPARGTTLLAAALTFAKLAVERPDLPLPHRRAKGELTEPQEAQAVAQQRGSEDS